MISKAQIESMQLAENFNGNAESNPLVSADDIIVGQQREIENLKSEIDTLMMQNADLSEKVNEIQAKISKLFGLFEAWQEKLDAILQVVENHLTYTSFIIDNLDILVAVLGIFIAVLVAIGVYVVSNKRIGLYEKLTKEISEKLRKDFPEGM